jgi:hypothetical protein
MARPFFWEGGSQWRARSIVRLHNCFSCTGAGTMRGGRGSSGGQDPLLGYTIVSLVYRGGNYEGPEEEEEGGPVEGKIYC